MYRNKKSHCKKEGIPFPLTFEEFKGFAIEVDFIRGRGRSKKSNTIDRIEKRWPNGKVRGYDRDNIQKLPNGMNVSKKIRWKSIGMRGNEK
jgi:hypothetical protein